MKFGVSWNCAGAKTQGPAPASVEFLRSGLSQILHSFPYPPQLETGIPLLHKFLRPVGSVISEV